MTIAQLVIVAEMPEFLARVRYYLIKAAIAVTSEDAGTANHANRLTYANSVLTGVNNERIVSYSVLSNPTIAAAVSEAAIADGDIEFQINSVFNALANANV